MVGEYPPMQLQGAVLQGTHAARSLLTNCIKRNDKAGTQCHTTWKHLDPIAFKNYASHSSPWNIPASSAIQLVWLTVGEMHPPPYLAVETALFSKLSFRAIHQRNKILLSGWRMP